MIRKNIDNNDYDDEYEIPVIKMKDIDEDFIKHLIYDNDYHPAKYNDVEEVDWRNRMRKGSNL